MRHTLSFSGAGNAGTFYGSVSSHDQEGVTPNSDYYKYSFLVNSDIRVSDKITYNAKINYIRTGGKRFRDAQGILEGMGYWHNMWDVNGYPWKDANGDKTWFSGGVPHPQWIVNEEGEDWALNRWIGNMGFTWDIHEWFIVDYKVGLDNYSEDRTEVRPIGSVNTASNLGDMTEIRLTNMDLTSDLIVRGQGDLNSDWDLSYLVGFNIFKQDYDRIRSIGRTFVLRDFYDISNTVTTQTDMSQWGRMLVGLYGDLTVGFKNQLYLQLTGRNDWSSTLPIEANSFFYPSASFTWVASEMLDASWLSLLKLRASYASMANDAPVQALNDVFIKQDPNVFGLSRFTTSNSQNNPLLKPESTSELEFGFDFRVLNNAIGLDFSWYDRTSTDQIIRQPVSSATGYTTKLVNLGEVNNKGIEAVLTINDTNPNPLNWNFAINFTRNRNTVVKIGESTEDDLDRVILQGGWWSNAQMIAVEGRPYGEIYGYPWNRYNPDGIDPNEDIDAFLDLPWEINANGQPTRLLSRVVLGNVNPDWIMGLNGSLDYKGIMFGFTLERRQGGDIVNGFEQNLVYSGLSVNTQERWYADDAVGANSYRTWEGVQADGSPNTTPGTLDNTFYYFTMANVDESIVEDGSWWRLRNIYIGYALPTELLASTFLTKAEITFSGRNTWLSTPYTGNDPEISSTGAGNAIGFDELQVPNTKSYEIGLRLGF
jgi:hypothetical protein